MTPSKLYDRDYTLLTCEERRIMEDFLDRQESMDVTRLKPFSDLPEAVRKNMSLFPNNAVSLWDMKRTSDLAMLNEEFRGIIHGVEYTERDVLNYINHTPAYHIVCSILHNRFQFGHHECYLLRNCGWTTSTDVIMS